MSFEKELWIFAGLLPPRRGDPLWIPIETPHTRNGFILAAELKGNWEPLPADIAEIVLENILQRWKDCKEEWMRDIWDLMNTYE